MSTYFADGDLDGIVDIDDRLVWEQNYGLTLPLPPYDIEIGGGGLSPVAGGVPEPSSALLLVLASGASLACGRRRPRG
jgi:hypothetical protein